MSTLWKCIVMENNTRDSNKTVIIGKSHGFLFNLHVKGVKSVQLIVNGTELGFSVADRSAPYDGDTIYFYENGESVHVVCRNPHSTGSVHLEYFTKDATNISDSATFFIPLHSGSNSSYIDCVYNTTEPADTYVYRVTFVIKKRLSLNQSNIVSDVHNISPSQDKINESSSPILGSCIGAAVLVFLGLTGAACWYVRTRNAKHAKSPYVDLSKHYDSPTSQCPEECENQYEVCHYSEHLPSSETYYETPQSVENNIDPEDHYYKKIDYLGCKPKIGESQTRNSEVYDEPYIHITMTDGMQESQRV